MRSCPPRLGVDPIAERGKARIAAEANTRDTLRNVAEQYLKREGAKLRSLKIRRRIFERLIFPSLGGRPISSIKRSEIVRLLDHVEDHHGATTAQHTLAALRRLCNWYASRDDDFISPIVRNMGRIKLADHARKRILSDDELRAVWQAAGAIPACSARWCASYCSRRHGEQKPRSCDGTSSRAQIGCCHPGATRRRSKLVRPLSAAAQSILASIPRISGCDYVFTYTGRGPITGFSTGKNAMDRGSEVSDWTLHDLRRTRAASCPVPASTRTLPSGASATSFRAYAAFTMDQYRAEMLHAFEALSAQIERILDPQPNVLPLRG